MPTLSSVSARIDDLRIQDIHEVLAPCTLLDELPASARAAECTERARHALHRILHGMDHRLAVVVGPCSVHDVSAAEEYATRLAEVAGELAEHLLIVMRVYFEKPRTIVGWKGLINDPHLDGSYDINTGLRLARRLLLAVNDLGLPAGTEFLDMITPQYIADLVGWGAIGARTTESQVHRQLASGLSCCVGFKNGTDGNVRIAIDAIRAAAHPHQFLSVTKAGHAAIVATRGNEDCHLILRGGRGPNYDPDSVQEALSALSSDGLPPRLMIDFSHANSSKDFRRQMDVGREVAARVAAGEPGIFGVMIESNLVEGRQDLHAGRSLVRGQSITDGCLGWDGTVELLQTLARAVQRRAG